METLYPQERVSQAPIASVCIRMLTCVYERLCGKYLELALSGLHLSALENLGIGRTKRQRSERGGSQMLMKIL